MVYLIMKQQRSIEETLRRGEMASQTISMKENGECNNEMRRVECVSGDRERD